MIEMGRIKEREETRLHKEEKQSKNKKKKWNLPSNPYLKQQVEQRYSYANTEYIYRVSKHTHTYTHTHGEMQ